MSETSKRDAVLEEFAHDAGVHRVWGVAGMADAILRLRAENTALRAAVERVRALHGPYHQRYTRLAEFIDHDVCDECETKEHPCPTLRALEGTP